MKLTKTQLKKMIRSAVASKLDEGWTAEREEKLTETAKVKNSDPVSNLLSFLFEAYTKTDEMIQRTLRDWVENGVQAPRKLYWFPPKELFRYREFHRPTRKDLQKSMREKGFDPAHPLLMRFGRNGVVVIVEGNHRLKTSIQLGIEKIPVLFQFNNYVQKDPVATSNYRQERDRKILRQQQKIKRQAAFDRKYGISKERRQEELEKQIALMTPEELKKRKKDIDELLDLLGTK